MPPLDPKDLDAQIAEVEARLAKAQEDRELLELLRRVRRMLVKDGLLPSPQDNATLATDMEGQTREQRVSRARLRRENRRHPFVAALVAQGLTVTEIASELGYSRSTVQSWYDSRPENARPIPRAAAEKLRDRLGVPLTAWRKLVD